jgi:hypothetical protein
METVLLLVITLGSICAAIFLGIKLSGLRRRISPVLSLDG